MGRVSHCSDLRSCLEISLNLSMEFINCAFEWGRCTLLRWCGHRILLSSIFSDLICYSPYPVVCGSHTWMVSLIFGLSMGFAWSLFPFSVELLKQWVWDSYAFNSWRMNGLALIYGSFETFSGSALRIVCFSIKFCYKKYEASIVGPCLANVKLTHSISWLYIVLKDAMAVGVSTLFFIISIIFFPF